MIHGFGLFGIVVVGWLVISLVEDPQETLKGIGRIIWSLIVLIATLIFAIMLFSAMSKQ